MWFHLNENAVHNAVVIHSCLLFQTNSAYMLFYERCEVSPDTAPDVKSVSEKELKYNFELAKELADVRDSCCILYIEIFYLQYVIFWL